MTKKIIESCPWRWMPYWEAKRRKPRWCCKAAVDPNTGYAPCEPTTSSCAVIYWAALAWNLFKKEKDEPV